MKPLSKPLSSPGRRADKFPPPLMRFLRSNVASRSRGRSRSSPIFHLRSKKRLSAGGVIETTQEPSSPKVTCIGQVRVRRKNNSPSTSNRRRRRRCLWLNKSLFRCRFPKRLFRMWKLIFRSNCCRGAGVEEGDNHNSRVKTVENSDRKSDEIENHQAVAAVDNNNNNTNNNKFRNSVSSNESETEFYRSYKNEEISGDVIENSSSPPKNALLLTRCRSAPYKSSSLAGRFWGEEKLGGENEGKKSSEGLEKPKCEENVHGDEENCREMEKKIEELKAKNRGIAVHPLLLTRCKSEPARKGERLGNFLMQRRLEDDISSST